VLHGRCALITGGGSGIGLATTRAFAAAGARIAVIDLSFSAAQAAAREIVDGGGEAIAIGADVSDPRDVERAIGEIAGRFGRIDAAFNNAGYTGDFRPTAECTLDNWSKVMAVNLSGVFYCMQHEIRCMLKSGGGAIVNTSSGAGLSGKALLPAYTASKHGVVGLTRTAAIEYARSGIRINAICPGAVRTPMLKPFLDLSADQEKAIAASQPMARLGEPEEIAAAVVWLCSDAASFVTGAAMPVDGGMEA
jgi:NAD(P)-dependent dehydrogenase (short-subunit alcohol dehydrogenase family)